MPSFSGLLKSSRRESSQFSNQERNATLISLDESAEKAQRRKSKRDFFRNLLRRTSRSEPKPRSGQFLTSGAQRVSSPTSPEPPVSPMSNPNKPLPPPPRPGSVEPELSTIRPVKQLQRIISPIKLEDLHKLFSGAPQFFARSEGHHTGAPHPSVAFPFDIELEIRDLTDHIQIHDEAWTSITAWPHITRDVQRDFDSVKEHQEKREAHFLPRCRERPNMLSMQGIERGSMGYGAALESGVADALRESEQSLPEGGLEYLSELRKQFVNGKDGLRHLSQSTILELLSNVGTTYHDDPLKHQRPTVQLYSELFTQILFPPSRVTDAEDPYSLQVQIEELIKILGAPSIWFDFGLVEWRIRLGQILWGPPVDFDLDDDVEVNNNSFQEQNDHRYWLLLQILLSCELLLRLDAVSANFDLGIKEPKPSEIKRFDKLATVSVRWSLILARQWLENIKVVNPVSAVPEDKIPAAASGWLASLTGAAASLNVAPKGDAHQDVQFQGRNQERQLKGLVHFAKKLNWPNLDTLAEKVSSNSITLSESAHSTPSVGTPLSSRRSNSYFSSRPGMQRGMSRSRPMSSFSHSAGWLSNSYISGLILPGEGLSHFLISTLLENDSTAISRLGHETNLYGGFMYSNRSFWSTACVVGRVLAAGKGASECMGWISSEISPRGAGEVWVDIDVEQLSEILEKNNEPRIWHKTAIEHDGNVIGGADTSSVLPGDFILPSEESIQTQALVVKLESLDLFAAIESVHTTPTNDKATPLSDVSGAPRIQTYSAMLRFSVDEDGQDSKEISLELRYDIHFVTAFPCVSSNHTSLLKSPTDPSFQSPPHSPAEYPRDFTGHPLHKGFTYTKISLSTLLSSPRNNTFESLLSPPQSPISRIAATHSSTHTTNSTIPRVLVIDCTDLTAVAFPIRPSPSPHLGHNKHKFGSDIEMLARAVCAERGWNALISRRGRGCLACSIREAGALGWRVILRFA